MKTFSLHTKKAFAGLLVLLLTLSLAACNTAKNQILDSLGTYEDFQSYTLGEFQDYTDYCKYFYTAANTENNPYFSKIQEQDLTDINEHIDDYEAWIEAYRFSNPLRPLVLNYDFDRTLVDTEDYFYLLSEKEVADDGFVTFVKYELYFFDSQSLVLYYFHNNL